VEDVVRPEIKRACVEVLHTNGFAVVEVAAQGCCGALAMHGGRMREALQHARRNVVAFDSTGVDYVITSAAGCGAMMKDYGRVLARDDRASAAARRVSDKVRDVCELLAEAGMREPLHKLSVDGVVAYHDACHLLHARGIASAPRSVIAAAIGRQPTDLGENTICCGSAGSYNLEHPALAGALGARKAELARGAAAALIAVGNVGCILQLERALALEGLRVPVSHPVELLAQAYVSETGRAAARVQSDGGD
jgi:glycolate oxidase iron-sulfur subunit